MRPETPKSHDEALSAQFPKLSVEQKALAFIVLLGIFGAVLGGISTEIDIRNCTQNPDCALINLSQRRFQGFQNGGLAGMTAALIASWPSLIQAFKK